MSAKKTRNTPIKVDDDLGIKLYGPTPSNHKFRLDYTDPFTGQRYQPRRTDKADAFALWDETVEYLSAAKHATQLGATPADGAAKVDRSGGPIVDDLFAKLEARWRRLHRSERYIQSRSKLYANRLHPVIGKLGVRAWGSSSEHCEIVIGNALTDGLAPATVQNVGSLLRGLVSQAWRERWLPKSVNPMEDVPYVAAVGEQGQSEAFIPESDRPSTGAVERLLVAYEALGNEVGSRGSPTGRLPVPTAVFGPASRTPCGSTTSTSCPASPTSVSTRRSPAHVGARVRRQFLLLRRTVGAARPACHDPATTFS